MNLTLNQIIELDESWSCNVFEFDKINLGNILIQWNNIDDIRFESDKVEFRRYNKTKKIIAYGKNATSNYCAIDFYYFMWKCIHCKKICNISERCYCGDISKCWTPINPVAKGVVFLDTCNYNYHFDDYTKNIIHE